jgi:general secretion pathway protein J
MKRLTNPFGFTLIEVLVALVVFSVLSVLGYQGLAAVLDYEQRSRTAYEEQMQLHRATSILLQDFIHLRPRPTRDRLGGRNRAYQTTDPDYEVSFVRGGLPSVPGSSFGGMQRIAYSVSDEDELLRWVWPVLEAFTEAEPESSVLMGSVESFEVFQLNAANEFEENWPPLNETLREEVLPRMIRLEITMLNGATVERLIPGVETVPPFNGENNGGDEQDGDDNPEDPDDE